MNDNEYMQRVRAMEPRLHRIAQAILWRDADSADAIQEAVFRGWMKKNTLREPAYLETWLIRVLINECKDVLKRRKRESMGELPELSAEDRLCEDIALRQALRRLPEKYRLPLLLHHMEGYSIKDIAAMLGIPPTRVKSRLHYARGLLRDLLEGGESL